MPQVIWTKLLGSSDYDWVSSLTTGSDGAIYVAGVTSGNLDGQVNNGNEDAFVTKYNTDGTKAWTKLLGTGSYDWVSSLTTGSDGAIYVAGSTYGNLDGQTNSGGVDSFVTKYNTDGTKAWTKLLGGSGNDYAYSLTTGSDGAIYVAGGTNGNLDGQVNSGDRDAFVTKYNTDGTKAWTKLLGTSSFDQANSLTTGSDGAIYVAGYTGGNLDGQVNSGGVDSFVTKYNTDGTKAWTKLLGGSSDDYANSLTTGSDGAIYVAGVTYGNLDGQTNSGGVDSFVTKYNTDGTKAWTKLLGGSSYDIANSLTTGSDGAIYVAGYTDGNLDGQVNSGSNDAFVTKYNTDGTKAWTKLLGGSSYDYANSLTTGSDGAIYVAGVTYGNLNGQTNSGDSDAFVIKLNVNEAPVITSPATATFAENGTGTVYTVTATDVDTGTTLTYSLSGTDVNFFNINNGVVTFKTAPNFEVPGDNGANNVYDINVIASDGTLTATKAVAITVTNVNEAPVITSAATATFAENGTGTVYTVTATDVDTGTTLTYSLSGTDVNLFNINNGVVTFKTAPNFEVPGDNGANNVYDINVIASDGTLTATQAVAITVTNVNEAPVITSAATATFAENGTGTVYTVTATDVDAGTTLTYSLSGTDVNLFNINNGVVTFKTAPNFEVPGDNGANNVYDINVIASDGTLTATQAVAITVTNVNEAPVITSAATATFAENGTGTVYTVTATDVDTGTTLTYSLSGTDVNLFNINNGVVTFKTAPNFEVPGDNGANNVYDINVIASDGTLTATQAVAITVTNVNEPSVIWTKLLGTGSYDWVSSLTTGSDGAIYVAGVTGGNLDGQVNSGSYDGFVTKYNTDGTKAWTKLLGGSSYDYANSLTTGSDGAIYVAGYTGGNLDGQVNSGNEDAFVTKYNTDGTKAWTKLLGGSSYDIAMSLTTGSDGAIYVAGYTDGNLDGQVNSGNNDAFVTKYNTDGTKAWTKLLGGSGADYANSLTTGSDGAIYVAGSTNGNLDGQTNSGGVDSFVTKYNTDGTKAWTKLLGTSGADYAYSLTTGSDGAIYVAGYTYGNLDGQVNSGSYDTFVTKYNTDGTKAWTKLLGGSSNDIAYSLTTGSDGAIYVAGYTSGNLDGQVNSGGVDAFVTKYNTDGTKVWTKLLGSSVNDYAYSLTTGSDGAIYVAGYTCGNLNGQVNSGIYDAFVIKLNVNEAPVITSPATATFAENGTGTVYTVTATSTSTNLTYSLSGTDVNLFNINNGVVTFKTAPNFEVPGDNGANNVYDINVIASDGSLTATQAVVITVTDVNDIVQSSVSYTLNSSETDLALIGTANIDGTGNSLNNAIFGNSGNNVLDGRAGADSLFGNAGDDTLIGGLGADTMTGGIGNDWYWVDDAGDSVIEYANEGTDKVFTSISYTLTANVEDLALQEIAANINGTGNILNNTITDNSKDNILDGGAGNDIIRASGGNDTLIGGLGADTLTGGLGNDRFVYTNLTDSLLGGIDIIKDFNNSTDTDRFVVTTARSVFNNVGVVSGLNATAIGSKLTTSNFGANAAALFTIGSKSYVAINDSIAGFNALSDAIVDITGYKGTLSAGSFVTV
ncbi:MAG: hypothetical protein HEQ12_14835 [Aphanizomenon flos-aquae DEX188]|nr:MAG: hypothetical protein HEQ12_14835 [Aphanizomenon flos-aquae DEX188]